MSQRPRIMRSDYLEWAKLDSSARFTLATSGIMSVPRAEFPFAADEIEITAPGAYGYPPLHERIAHHARVPVECVVTAMGTSMANHLVMAAMLEPGDEVLIEQPAYGPLLDVADYLGARVRRFQRCFGADFAPSVEEIAQAVTPATRLIVLTNLHNPSGALVPAEVLQAIGEFALRLNVRVLVDEVYLEMLFERDAPWSLAIGQAIAGYEANPFIVTSSLTKAYGLGGLRCGWILAGPKLAGRIARLNDLFGANAAHPAERLSVIAFDHLDRFRERARTLLAANRPLLDRFLDSRDDLECVRPVAGTVVFPRLLRGDAESFAHLLREKYETSVVPGGYFELPQHFRIGIGGATDELRGGLERLSAALDEFQR